MPYSPGFIRSVRTVGFVQDEDDVILKCLKDLEGRPMSLEILEVTRIGVLIRRLRKHANQEVAALARKLYDNWISLALRGRERRKTRERVAAASDRFRTESSEGLCRFGISVEKTRRSWRGAGFDADVFDNGAPIAEASRRQREAREKPKCTKPSEESTRASTESSSVRGAPPAASTAKADSESESDTAPPWWRQEEYARWRLRKRRRAMGRHAEDGKNEIDQGKRQRLG